jgi:anaerobic selenocysteine-containing dehydrogenase
MTKLGSDILSAHDPVLKAAWIERGNPVLQSPDTNSVKKAFSALRFKIVVEQFMTDTASFADIILPAKDMFEQSDILGSYWSPYVQFKPKVIQSPGEVMPESEIYYNLSQRMKMKISTDQIPEPGNENIELWLERRILKYSEITLDQLKKAPLIAPRVQEIAWQDMKFETQSGKIEIYSSEAKAKWGISSLPDYHGVHNSPEKEKFPLELITPNTGGRIHSQFGNLKIIKETTAEPVIRISPADAKMRKIISGQKIRVFNLTGELIGNASVSNRVPTGIVVFPNGIWFKEGGGVNHLISAEETDIGFGAAFHDNRVEIERAD